VGGVADVVVALDELCAFAGIDELLDSNGEVAVDGVDSVCRIVRMLISSSRLLN
jgi:hypothetical protein